MKQSYLTSTEKKVLRSRLLPHGHTLIGLGGPDIEEYVDTARKRGFKDIRVWENNPAIYMKTLPLLKGLNIQYNIDDILNAPVHSNYIYDLDFCCRIERTEPYIRKFQNNFILTISEMYTHPFSALPLFAQYRDEVVKNIVPLSECDRILVTDKGRYLICRYRDTSPMLIIKPFSIS